MNLEPVVQSEVELEREKQISYINSYIENLEKYTYEPIYMEGSVQFNSVAQSFPTL